MSFDTVVGSMSAAGILLGLALVAAAIALPVLLNRFNGRGRRPSGGGGGDGAIGHDTTHDSDRSGGWSWDGGGWGGGGDGGGGGGGDGGGV